MFKNSKNQLSGFLSRFFPPPRFLISPSFGLDISDESVKFVELLTSKNGIKMGRYGERKLPVGIIESGKIKNTEKLKNFLTTLRQEEGIRFVRVSLPEEQVYLFALRLEKSGLKNIREGIELALEEHVPIPAAEAIFDYELIAEDEKSLEVQVAAIPQNVINNYIDVFQESFISIQSLELEAQSIARAVVRKGDMDTYLIVDFGQTRTGIFIVSRGAVTFTSTLEIGGELLNKMIEKNFNVAPEEAERMKRQYGLGRNTENQEVFSVLLNSVSILRDEIVKHSMYWNTHKDEEGNSRPPIQKIILCGGDANLIGLADYISVSTKQTVEMGNVWVNIAETDKYIPEISFNESLTFAAALGLALGDFDYD